VVRPTGHEQHRQAHPVERLAIRRPATDRAQLTVAAELRELADLAAGHLEAQRQRTEVEPRVEPPGRQMRPPQRQALGRAGYNVRATSSASTLWRWVEDGEGDLVITDVVMPDENGLDLLPRIKRIRPDLRVVVMSAQSTFTTAVKAAQRGAFEYLPKLSGWFFFLDPALHHYLDFKNGEALGGLFVHIDGYGGKAPGQFFSYAFSSDPWEPLWWSIYYCATGIHALHVVIGMSLIAWCWFRARRGAYGPTHYTMVENMGLYWHLVDLIWIFLFPLLYLIH
jgi:hypothetical protein